MVRVGVWVQVWSRKGEGGELHGGRAQGKGGVDKSWRDDAVMIREWLQLR